MSFQIDSFSRILYLSIYSFNEEHSIKPHKYQKQTLKEFKSFKSTPISIQLVSFELTPLAFVGKT